MSTQRSKDMALPEQLADTRVATPRARHGGCLDANQIAELLEGVLDDEARRAAEEHIDACSRCRELVGGLATRLSLVDQGAATSVALSRYARGWVSTLRSEHAAETHVLEPGDTLDHYQITRLIGRGGMGEVYLARDGKLDRDVAIKMVRFFHTDSDMLVKHFMTEARMTARLNHPHIVTVHAVGEHRGRPYLALEYVRGMTMRQWLREHRPAGHEVLQVALAIAEALEEAHAHDILHRDLKPENVLIDQRGRVRVVDFGLAVRLERGVETTAQDSVFTGVAGTPRYMAPEQWLDETQGSAVDIWALGVMLYELLSGGRHPAADLLEDHGSVVRFASVALVDAVSELPDDVDIPEALRDMVHRCLRKDPATRPSARDIVVLLGELLAEDASRELPPPTRYRRRQGWFGLLGVIAGGIAVWGLSSALAEPEPATLQVAPAITVAVPTPLPAVSAPPEPAAPDTQAETDPTPPVSAAPTTSGIVTPTPLPVTTTTVTVSNPNDPLDHW